MRSKRGHFGGPGGQTTHQDRPQHKQTALQTTKLIIPVMLLKVSDLGIHRTRPNSTYFKPNYGRWAPLDILKGSEATALSSKSTRLHLGLLHTAEKARCDIRPPKFPHLGRPRTTREVLLLVLVPRRNETRQRTARTSTSSPTPAAAVPRRPQHPVATLPCFMISV